jgi:hypothetical protein
VDLAVREDCVFCLDKPKYFSTSGSEFRSFFGEPDDDVLIQINYVHLKTTVRFVFGRNK